jgi:hypothetical protein
MAGRIINVDLMLDQSSIYKVLEMPTKELLVKTVEEFEIKNPLYMVYSQKSLGQLQETYSSAVGSDRIKFRTTEMAVAQIGQGGQEGFKGTKTYRMYSGSFQITKVAVLEAKASGNFNAIAYNTADRTKTWLRNNVEDGVRALLGGFGSPVIDDTNNVYQFVTSDTVDGKTGQYAINSARNPLFSNAHTRVLKTGESSAAGSKWANDKQSNMYVVQDGAAGTGIDLLGSDPGKIAKLADVINNIVTNMENQKDDNGKYAGLHGEKRIVCANDARLKAALKSALDEAQLCGYKDQSVPNPAFGRIAGVDTSVYFNDLPCLFDKTAGKAVGFFIVDKGYMSANNGLEITQRFPLEVTSEEHKNPAFLDVIFSEGMEFSCLTWRGITYVCIAPASATNAFTIPAEMSASAAAVNIPLTAFTAITPTATAVKPVAIVGTVTTV